MLDAPAAVLRRINVLADYWFVHKKKTELAQKHLDALSSDSPTSLHLQTAIGERRSTTN